MKPSLRIKHVGRKWKLQGTTVVKDMNSTEMLFRIVTMTSNECSEMIDKMSDKQMHDIVMKIRTHRKEAQKANFIPKERWANVTPYVVSKHTKAMGWA